MRAAHRLAAYQRSGAQRMRFSASAAALPKAQSSAGES